MDGISQPAVNGFTVAPNPGQQVVDPGVILVGQTGDPGLSARPSWAKEGSFMAFRQLQQLVPEFNSYLSKNAPSVPGSSRQQRADLLGARMFGRWKSVSAFSIFERKGSLRTYALTGRSCRSCSDKRRSEFSGRSSAKQ
jgi:deferrochelatase/peroxidase EfeB